MQKVVGWHGKEGNYLEQDSIGQTTVESTDGGQHLVGDGHRLREERGETTTVFCTFCY